MCDSIWVSLRDPVTSHARARQAIIFASRPVSHLWPAVYLNMCAKPVLISQAPESRADSRSRRYGTVGGEQAT